MWHYFGSYDLRRVLHAEFLKAFRMLIGTRPHRGGDSQTSWPASDHLVELGFRKHALGTTILEFDHQ